MLKFFRVILAVLGFFAAVMLLAALFPSPAHAGDRVARQGNDQAVFTDAPCTHPDVVKFLTPEQVAASHAAVVTFQGKTYQACYVENPVAFELRFEDGDYGLVGKADLLPDA